MITPRSAGILLAFGAVFSLPPNIGKAADLPAGYTCHDLRNKVVEYGATVILASARSRGFSEKEIAQIRQKCRV
jgi:hypothetical protein